MLTTDAEGWAISDKVTLVRRPNLRHGAMTNIYGIILRSGSVLWKQWHVGKLRSRCLAEHRCTPVEAKSLSKLSVSAINTAEMKKQVPDRYPFNNDSLGIELVAGDPVLGFRNPDHA